MHTNKKKVKKKEKYQTSGEIFLCFNIKINVKKRKNLFHQSNNFSNFNFIVFP